MELSEQFILDCTPNPHEVRTLVTLSLVGVRFTSQLLVLIEMLLSSACSAEELAVAVAARQSWLMTNSPFTVAFHPNGRIRKCARVYFHHGVCFWFQSLSRSRMAHQVYFRQQRYRWHLPRNSPGATCGACSSILDATECPLFFVLY